MKYTNTQLKSMAETLKIAQNTGDSRLNEFIMAMMIRGYTPDQTIRMINKWS